MSCPDCFSGHVHSGKPLGREEKIHGRSTYIAEPSNGKDSKGIIVMISDAFGWEFVNNRIWADHIASKGDFLVYLPDFMDGHACDTYALEVLPRVMDTSLYGWLFKPYYVAVLMYHFIPFALWHNTFSASWPKVTSFLSAVRQKEGASLGIGTAGFCWGGKHVFNLAHNKPDCNSPDGKPLADAMWTAHPSNISIPGEVEPVRRPLSIANGDKDMALPIASVEKIKRILEGISDVESEVVVYPGAGHGFSVRADHTENPRALKQAEEAEDQAVTWYKKQFSKLKY